MIDAIRILPKLLSKAGDQPEIAEVAVKIAWSRAAGPGLREHAVPFRLSGKTLIVSVADVIWQKQLSAMKGEFIARTNRMLGQPLVDSIEFCIEPTVVDRGGSAPQRQLPLGAARKLPIELIEAASSISDDDLRQRFIRAAENCIERRNSRTSST